MVWVLEETLTPGVYQLGFFGDPRRRRTRSKNPREAIAVWTALVGTLDHFEVLGQALLAETAARRTAREQEAAG
jgi:hypothetical protein